MRYGSWFVVISLTAGLLAGCGKEPQVSPYSGPLDSEPESVVEYAEDTESVMEEYADTDALWAPQGKICNIYTYDEDLISYFSYLEGYEAEGSVSYNSTISGNEVIPKEGEKILYAAYKDKTVVWHIVEESLDTYQDVLDEALLNTGDSVDDRVDLFFMDSSLLQKYCDSNAGVASSLRDLGIYGYRTSNQYEFTKALASGEDQVQRASTWEAASGAFLYRKEIAGEVFGTDDPEGIQEYLSTWDSFEKAGDTLQKEGYYLLSHPVETYEPYLFAREKGWVSEEDRLQIDTTLENWTKDMKSYVEKGYVSSTEDPDVEESSVEPGEDSRVFGYFLSAGEAVEYLQKEEWGVCEGPASYAASCPYLLASSNSDNRTFNRDVMVRLTMDGEILERIMQDTGILTNDIRLVNPGVSDANESNMSESHVGESDANESDMSESNVGVSDASESNVTGEAEVSSNGTGGENRVPGYLETYAAAAGKINPVGQSLYDYGMNRIFLQSLMPYLRDEVELNEALTAFYKNVIEAYPDIQAS